LKTLESASLHPSQHVHKTSLAKPVKEKTRRAIAYAAAGRINKKARSSIYSYESFSYGFSYTVSNVMTLGWSSDNYLAGEPVGIPIELQLTLKVVDDPADHSCAEAWRLRGLTGGPPVSHQNSPKLSAKSFQTSCTS
jgi:hypothetical protein